MQRKVRKTEQNDRQRGRQTKGKLIVPFSKKGRGLIIKSEK
jgi:hypothetical protein